MSHSYPIWNDVISCIYKTNKSYGARNTSQCVVRVGTSANNSEILISHITTRREQGEYVVFRFGIVVDKGIEILITKWMHAKTHEWFDTEPADINEITR